VTAYLVWCVVVVSHEDDCDRSVVDVPEVV
jgi:hypothetical protein